MKLRRTLAMVFTAIMILQLCGCAVNSGRSLAATEQSTAVTYQEQEYRYPRVVEGVGLVHEPVSACNLPITKWAWGWADAYDAEVFDVYTSRNFYYVVLRRDDTWLFAFETRVARPVMRIEDAEYTPSMSFQFLRPDGDVVNNLRPAGARAMIDPELDGVIRFSDRIVDEFDNDRMDWERERYTTYMPGDESTYWGHMPPIELHDDELGDRSLMVVWYMSYGPDDVLKRQYQIDSVYWLYPE